MILPPHVPRLHVRLVVLQDGHPVPFLHVAINFGPDIVIQSLSASFAHCEQCGRYKFDCQTELCFHLVGV